MHRLCPICNNLMNYDPYFKADVCVECGKMIRDERTRTHTKMKRIASRNIKIRLNVRS